MKERRTWRHVYFPVDRSLFVLGTNVLALRVVGDPNFTVIGTKVHSCAGNRRVQCSNSKDTGASQIQSLE